MATHSLQLSGVEVEFPFQPYPCQLSYMEKVIQALQKSTNAILESPTGTGKTLCLLCAALGWREDLVNKMKGHLQQGDVAEGEELDPWDHPGPSGAGQGINAPKIIYASRTHSQLSQVIQELKNTKYRPQVSIIGSREQLCIHPEVSKKESNAEKVHLCRAKVKSRACFYYNNTDVKRAHRTEAVMDIEDLVLLGTRQRMCPYYLARELKSQADLIFMPYNYILDIKTRQMHGIDVDGTVVILDEAHNIERVCEDSASFDLTSGDFAQCIGDLDHIFAVKKNAELYSSQQEGDQEDMEDFLNVKQFFISLEESLDKIVFPVGKREIVKPGRFMLEFFRSAGLHRGTCATLIDQLSKVISFLTSDSHSAHRNGNSIQKFVDAVKIVFASASPGVPDQNSSHHYKVFIKSEEPQRRTNRSDSWAVSVAEPAKKEIRSLGYWCFSPGHAMAELVGQGVRSVILTSGTLSPLDSFSSELAIDFPIRYEGPHVISERQICVGVVSKGCDGVALNSSYANRSTVSYQTSLGNTLVNFSRCVPHGLLVFFPSYPVMNGCAERWRENGILQRIELNKPVFLEPRRKAEFNSTMDAFYEKISDPAHNGAAFFAVCRGKVSEGLDFADMNGRAVVITGLPYPPRMDPKVTLKMQYLQDTKQATNGLSGEEWYRQQASRAVNQAVGRVIRHRLDYGAILLCDERFCYSNSLNQLPQWVQPHIRTYDKFGLVQRDLNLFFKNAAKEFGHGKVKDKPSAADHPVTGDSSPSSSHVRVPIVAKDLTRGRSGYRRALEQAQDASVVETHVPSKKIPEASLRRLKMETDKDSSESLLSSLVKCESGSKPKKLVDLYTPPELAQASTATTPSLSEAIMQEAKLRHHQFETAPSSSACTSAVPGVARKKIVFISKDQKVNKSKTMKGQEASKSQTIKGYLEELQSYLSRDSYLKFKESMCGYSKEKDIHKFMESLKSVFKRRNLFHLLEGVSRFITEEHKEVFATFYQSFTGSSLVKVAEKNGVATGSSSTGSSASGKGVVKRASELMSSDALPKVKVQRTRPL